MACEMFKIVNKLSTEYIQDIINIKTSTYNFRGERKANIPRVNTNRYGLRSFRSEALRIWKSLHITCGWQSHARSLKGCSRAGMALDVGALCVVPSFVFCCLFICYRALLCCLSFYVKILSIIPSFCTLVP